MENNYSGIPKSKRSRSPYHKKCIPPFVDSSQIDKHLVSKLDRTELEDRYIVLTDENLSLKRLLNEHQKKIQRLCTQLQRQEVIDKKEGKNTAAIWNENQINVLYQQNRVLQAKVNVLSQQLQSHSRMHARVHKSHNVKGKCTPVSSPNHHDGPAVLEKYAVKSLPATGEDMKHFQYFQQEFGVDIEEMDANVAELEREYGECTLNENDGGNELEKVMDNVELIRLRRCNKRQAAHIAALSDHLESAEKELHKLRKIVEKNNQESEELTKQLQRERQKLREIQGSAVQSSTQAQAIKDLEEQIRDLQNEKKSLKDYNQKLLELTQKNGSDEAAKSKPEKGIEIPIKISVLETQELREKIITLQNRLDESVKNNTVLEEESRKLVDEYRRETVKLKEDNNELQKKLHDALSEIGLYKENQVSASNINRLKEELFKQTRECEELKKHLEHAVMRSDNLRIQASNGIEEYKEMILKLEKEKEELHEKLTEAQNKIINMEKQVIDGEAMGVNDLKEELFKQTRKCEELKRHLECAVMQIDNLRMQAKDGIEEYRKRILKLEKEKDGLHEKLNEAQNKIVNMEKHVVDGEATGAGREIYSSNNILNENKRGEMDTDDVALVVLFLKEMSTELERCYNIISCQHEINKHLLVTIEYFSVYKSSPVLRVSETLLKKIVEDKDVNLTTYEIKNKIEKEELCSPKTLFIAELKTLGLLERHFSLISQQLHKIQLICQVIKPVMLQAIQVIQEPNSLQYGFCKRKENGKEEYKCKPAIIESVTSAAAEPMTAICQFEIYISEVIFDRNSFNYLESVQSNPKVNLAWCFLDLHTNTSVQKAKKACFESSTVYCGPLTQDVKECLKQNPVEVVCNVVENNDQNTAVAKGQINVIEAFQNPGNTIETSVILTGENVHGELFCRFCLHCDEEYVKSQQSVIKEHIVQEVHSSHTPVENGNNGERDCIPTSEWKLTNGNMKDLTLL